MALSGYLKELRDVVGHRALLVPAVAALIVNDHNEVLLHRSSDDALWHTIGGAMEPGEEPAQTAVREAYEETGLNVRPERVTGVYAWPRQSYPNGDICDYVGILFRCSIESGTLRISDESLELRFFPTDQLPPLLPIEVLAIRHAFEDGPAYFESATK